MEILAKVVNTVINAGATVFMPLIMIIVGIAVGMKLKDAINSGLLIGVAFVSVNLVLGYMISSISPAAEAFIKATGINLTVLDVGWPTAAAITWSWPYVFLIFPICLIINLVMISLKLTDTMNVDVWNYWGKAFTAVIVWYFSGSVVFGLVVAGLQCIIELKIGDAIALPCQELTGVPGVTCPHQMFLVAAFAYPIDLLLSKIPALNKKIDASALQDKFGFFCENHVIGFIMGFAMAMIGKLSLVDAVLCGINIGATLVLFPRVTKIFMESLSPISDRAAEFLRKKVGGRELYVGLDWPFLSGRNEMWIVTMLQIPFMMLFAIITPGNAVLPLASVTCIVVAIVIMITSDANILRMLIVQCVLWPAFYLIAGFVAPALTSLAQQTGAYVFQGGISQITFLGQEAPFWKFFWSLIGEGKILLGAGGLAVWGLGMWKFLKDMKRKSAEILAKREAEE